MKRKRISNASNRVKERRERTDRRSKTKEKRRKDDEQIKERKEKQLFACLFECLKCM